MRTARRAFGALAAFTVGVSAISPVFAQSVQQTFDKIEQMQKQGPSLQRAMNLARTKAISLNGGLSNYTPEACMFSTTLVVNAAYSKRMRWALSSSSAAAPPAGRLKEHQQHS